jgi:hypothetical protein
MNRSRQKAFLTGANGSYSTDNVRGSSELADMNGFNGSIDSGYVGNYNNAYKGGMNGSVFLGNPDYSNQGDLLHNNVAERVLLEQLLDNKLFIDTSIRDFSKSVEPFRFVVKFNGTEAKTEDIYVIINGETFSYPKYISGDTDVVMDRVFKNIKIVAIDTLILPNYIAYKTNDDGSYEKDGRQLAKTNHKYLILKIAELSNNRCFSNNKAFGKESFIMKMDDEVCHHNHRWIPASSSSIVYPDSRLQVINRLTVEICDDKGVRLCPTLDGKNHDFFGEYRKLIDRIEILQKENTKKSRQEIDELLPKMISLRDITQHLAPELHMTLGILEPQVNTLPQYRA